MKLITLLTNFQINGGWEALKRGVRLSQDIFKQSQFHAKTGRETEAGFREKIEEYREQFAHAL